LQRAVCVAASEPRTADALKQVEQGGAQTAYLAIGPEVVRSFKGFATPEHESTFEGFGVRVVATCRCEEPVEVVEVPPDLGAVELVAVGLVEPTDLKSNRSARLPGGRMSLEDAE
jgi:hypothetical protein